MTDEMISNCPACIDKLGQDDRLRNSSADLILEALNEYHLTDHGDRRKSPPQLRMEQRARDAIARRLPGRP